MPAVSDYEMVVGLEVHAELATHSKMFCACPAVLDPSQAKPNVAVCPVCAGMPGTLPVINRQAVEMAIKVGLALDCQIMRTSIFERKNYIYPDLPKGYQISQYESPLAVDGKLEIQTGAGPRIIRIRRAHLEEDTGKLTHVHQEDETYSLVDLNRAGVPLLEIVTEPDMRSIEEVRAYASGLRALLRALGVNSGDMEKGVIRFEANVSVRPKGSAELGTRVEIKNLNSFRALERSMLYEFNRQVALDRAGQPVIQETLGWDDQQEVTYSQRSKEDAHDYRYFPEPDLPPLLVEPEWVEQVRATLPELPRAKAARFMAQYDLSAYDAEVLVFEGSVAGYFEQTLAAAPGVSPKMAANWITGELFGLMKQSAQEIDAILVSPAGLGELLSTLSRDEINPPMAKSVLAEMFASGESAQAIIQRRGLRQVSDSQLIAGLVAQVLQEHPDERASYLNGKETLSNWFFGQVMRVAGGQANPQVVRGELARQLQRLKDSK